MTIINNDFRIVKLNKFDALFESDHLISLKELVLQSDNMYPNIIKWFNEKVITGIKNDNRVGYVGYLNDKPIVSAIVKLGVDSKFCHLKIGEEFQDENLGNVFFTLMALETRQKANQIHFTLPESLWETKREFFKSFGFNDAAPADDQYRLFDQEFKCVASFSKVWDSVIKKLPKLHSLFSSIGGYNLNTQLILSIHPKYADMILSGNKRVEIRKKFSLKWSGLRINLYSTKPMQSIVGEAKIRFIDENSSSKIWDKYSTEIGCSKEEYDDYVNSDEKTDTNVYAIGLDEVLPYNHPIPISQLSHILNEDLTPPQSYCSLDNNQKWSDAITIATLLHSQLRKVNAHPQFIH